MSGINIIWQMIKADEEKDKIKLKLDDIRKMRDSFNIDLSRVLNIIAKDITTKLRTLCSDDDSCYFSLTQGLDFTNSCHMCQLGHKDLNKRSNVRMYKLLTEQSVKKIQLIDELRQRFSVEDNEKLRLPQIIVVGDQSSGKSSILEAISGIKLPRGVDTVTKCPVIIQMRRNNGEPRTRIKYKMTEFHDITDTEAEIRQIQTKVFGDKLTKEPITLLIESPNVETLTIIDLPGFVKTKTEGQAKDIVEMTHSIAKDFMIQDNSLIICVLPGNQDISTTTTIKLAAACNSDKSRMIGVLTKLDKIDEKEATLIPDILRNHKIPIKKGYYGLIVGDDVLYSNHNERSNKEEEKFKIIGLWTDSLKNRLGLKKFIEALVVELVDLIDKTLPFLEDNINKLLNETNLQLNSFSKYYGNRELQFEYMIETVDKINKKIEDILTKGDCEVVKYDEMKTFLEQEKSLSDIRNEDTFLYYWHSMFKELFDKYNDIFKEQFSYKKSPYNSAKDLEEIIKRSRTDNLSYLNNPKPFKLIVDKTLEFFKNESFQCVDKFYEVVKYVIENVLTTHIESKLDVLKKQIEEFGIKILDMQKQEVVGKITYLFQSESSYFSQEPIDEEYDIKEPSEQNVVTKVVGGSANYMTQACLTPMKLGQNLVPQGIVPQSPVDQKPPVKDQDQYKNGIQLKQKLEKYIKNLIQRFGDIVPNFIILSLFNNFQMGLKKELSKELFNSADIDKYFNLNRDEKDLIERLKETRNGLIESQKELRALKNGYTK